MSKIRNQEVAKALRRAIALIDILRLHSGINKTVLTISDALTKSEEEILRLQAEVDELQSTVNMLAYADKSELNNHQFINSEITTALRGRSQFNEIF